DDRCRRAAFLAFLEERLHAHLDGSDAPTPLREQGGALARVRILVRRIAPSSPVVLLLDGLDEIVAGDRTFVSEVVATLAADVTCVCVSRPLPEGAGLPPELAVEVFPDGLPPMDEAEVRTMLLEGLEGRRRHLLTFD